MSYLLTLLWRYFRRQLIQLFYSCVVHPYDSSSTLKYHECHSVVHLVSPEFLWTADNGLWSLLPPSSDHVRRFVVSWRSAGIHRVLGCKNILRFYWRNVAHVYFLDRYTRRSVPYLTPHTILYIAIIIKFAMFDFTWLFYAAIHCHYYIGLNLQCLLFDYFMMMTP